ncbi:hypothetical protein P691DRAFT_562618 [Macrolepiota fuliginosa MF-IS2]|uniref:ditrans,polycis-polyprenyl diphosphate synthase [(2E,6E)-farnesyldiphosphate specific] n=1 Tax=Macrolepiota fuliginosa MF-IS2 TaxID=1400762 RepID=A0A9P5XQH2_9AGAR|nr:hypothetical protein P691DRAFT_562618 [Macrolepiota fuliginosa MF-IS2]
MELLPALVLRILHFLYALISLFHSFWKRQTRPYPQSLESPRRRLPQNLALVFVADINIPTSTVEKTILQSVLNAIEWCRTVGIPKLTLYEEHGLILHLEPRIREAVFSQDHEPPSSDSEIEYQPLTPPESVYSESRSLSPCDSTPDFTEATILQSPIQRIRNRKNKSSLATPPSQQPISLCLLSSKSSKAAVANLARFLYLDYKQKPKTTGLRIKKTFELKVDDMDELLESTSRFAHHPSLWSNHGKR